eukprot:jgi/Undpi1/7755/HiC_scaffold_23.g10228.m1
MVLGVAGVKLAGRQFLVGGGGGGWAADAAAGAADTANLAVSLPAAPTAKVMRTVIKFGGSSLATSTRLKEVAALVKMLIDEGQMPVMVCSAMGKTTNNLLNAGDFALKDGKVYIDAIQTLHLSACDELGLGKHTKRDIEGLLADLRSMLEGVGMLRELTARCDDRLVSYGERMSVRMMAATLNKAGVPAQHFDAWTLGMRTTGDFGNADVLDDTYPLIRETLSKFDPGMVAVVSGFLGQSPDKQITTLGRGGSDLTATVIGVACGADEVQVWKDVDGMMTADPRAVPGAVPVPCVSYEEAAELAYFGANILHPVSMRPAMKTGLPVRIKNSYNPSHPGTVIAAQRDCGETLVTAITFKRGVELVDIVSTRMLGQYGFLRQVFQVFAENSLSIDMVATSEVSISLTLDQEQDRAHLRRSIISLIANVSRSSEVMAEVFKVTRDAGVQVLMLSQGASKVNVGLVVKEEELEVAVQALHYHFFEEDNGVNPRVCSLP